MTPAYCTSGASACSEIPSTFVWGCKVPSIPGAAQGVVLEFCLYKGYIYASTGETFTHLAPPRSYLAAVAVSRLWSKRWELHTTCSHSALNIHTMSWHIQCFKPHTLLALVKEQCRLDMRKYSFSQRVINEWNKLPNYYVNASSVNMFKNRIDRYMIRAGYT